MIKSAFIFLLLAAGTILSRAETSNVYATIGQPSIFWRDGEWQVFQDGHWIPHSATRSTPVIEPQGIPEPLAQPEPEMVDTNGIYYDWGYGYGLPFFSRPHLHHFDRGRHFKKPGPRSLNDSSVGGVGQTTIGIGQQSGGLGQTTIGIGQPNGGIGQTTIGIGQPNAGLGQPTIAIGQPNTQLGKQKTGFGRPNARLGQTTIGIGQPQGSIGQPTIGIGQQSRSVITHSQPQVQQAGSHR
jgi:hypothetical protein